VELHELIGRFAAHGIQNHYGSADPFESHTKLALEIWLLFVSAGPRCPNWPPQTHLHQQPAKRLLPKKRQQPKMKRQQPKMKRQQPQSKLSRPQPWMKRQPPKIARQQLAHLQRSKEHQPPKLKRPQP